MDFRLLGAVEARTGDAVVDLGPSVRRAVLAVLLLDAGRPVPIETLIDRLWQDRPPERARDTLYSYLSRLRAVLSPIPGAAVERRSGGYAITVDPARVDLHRFRDLVSKAAGAVDDAEAAGHLEAALALWRGEPLTGVDLPWFERLRTGLLAERFAAEREYTDVVLRLGRHAAVLPGLQSRAEEYPLDERLAGQLMLALHRCGRSSEALERYGRLRQSLVEQLGCEPGAAVAELHRRILADDPSLVVGTGPVPVAGPVPRQLPVPPRGFCGRAAQLATLDDHREGVAVVTGPGGIGKTWLVRQWAQLRRAEFPDGQLYADLRGFDPVEAPRPGTVVLRGFLVALGVRPDAVPADPEEQAGLYRSLLSGKRFLVVLDNVRDSEQAKRLLGPPGCTTLLTSRRELPGLLAAHGARRLALPPFSRDEAAAALVEQLGGPRLAAEPQAVTELLDHCAGLPLALGILAVRADRYPESGLAGLAEELRDTAGRLDGLETGDLSASLRAVLAASEASLDDPAARAFALLGLVPGEDLGAAAVASLLAVPKPRARRVIAQLADTHLVEEHRPGRYRMHDLTRLYAAELAAGLPEADRRSGQRRLVDHYLHTANSAARAIHPDGAPIELAAPAAGTACAPPRGRGEAMAWYETEAANLAAIHNFARDLGWHEAVWQLAWCRDPYLDRTAQAVEGLRGWRLAATAAGRLPDPWLRQTAHRRTGTFLARLDRHAEAAAELDSALRLAERDGDPMELAKILNPLGFNLSRSGDHRRALAFRSRALAEYRKLGYREGEAAMLSALGWERVQLGDWARAREHAEAALVVLHDDPASDVVKDAQLVLGRVALGEGRAAQARELLATALSHPRCAGTYEEPDILAYLGRAEQTLGRRAEARDRWQRAARLYRRHSRFAEADRVEAELAGSDRVLVA